MAHPHRVCANREEHGRSFGAVADAVDLQGIEIECRERQADLICSDALSLSIGAKRERTS
eukprot:scaffold63_cov306-Pinguiococcus_pyrenoidosus.AAC.55